MAGGSGWLRHSSWISLEPSCSLGHTKDPQQHIASDAFEIRETLRSRPSKPNQRKSQNEKFMNFAHFFVNSGVFP